MQLFSSMGRNYFCGTQVERCSGTSIRSTKDGVCLPPLAPGKMPIQPSTIAAFAGTLALPEKVSRTKVTFIKVT
jgi:hypothetical protein